MPAPTPTLSDGQARNVILAAEAQGFRRDPDLHPNWYDALLHEHAVLAYAFLIDTQKDVAEALRRPDPIGPEEAAERLTNGRATLADVEKIIGAAVERGFSPPQPDLPLPPTIIRFDQGRSAIQFLWTSDPTVLNEILGEKALVSPTPADAWIPCSACGR